MVGDRWVYIGTYTDGGDSKGVYRCQLDGETGALGKATLVARLANPIFQRVHPTGRYLYVAHDMPDSSVPEAEGRPAGGVSAYAIDSETGDLDYLNTRPSRGVTPCHLDIDQTGRYLCVANYRGAEGGNVAMLPIGADGSLGAVTGFIQHYGSSQHPTRQTAPHAHSANVDPSNNHVLVADLGLDKVMIYELDLVEGGLLPHETPWVATESGAGPRHLAYHPLGQYAYVINELNSTMIVYAYDPGTGTLRELQVLSTLPPDYKGSNAPADVHVLPSGRFLYGSNRGHDSIVIYAIDAATGRLSLIGHEPTGGRNPRNFAIDPAGEFLWAANQDSDNIFTFCIDSATGELSPTGAVADVPRPVCLALYQRRS